MSVDYAAIPKCEETYLEVLKEYLANGKTEGMVFIDRQEEIATRIEKEFPEIERYEKDYEAIAEWKGISVEEARQAHSGIELNWEEDGFVQIGVYETEVGINTNGGGRQQFAMLERLFDILREFDLFIWDPQGGEFLTCNSSDKTNGTSRKESILRKLFLKTRDILS